MPNDLTFVLKLWLVLALALPCLGIMTWALSVWLRAQDIHARAFPKRDRWT